MRKSLIRLNFLDIIEFHSLMQIGLRFQIIQSISG